MIVESIFCEEAKRWLEVPGIYRHFKGNEYCVIGISRPEVAGKLRCKSINAKHTELKTCGSLFIVKDGEYEHLPEELGQDTLAIYRSIYHDGGIFARPMGMFLSEVDREKYPRAKQRYRMELIGGVFK